MFGRALGTVRRTAKGNIHFQIRITSLKIGETREEINVSQQAGPNLEGVGVNHSVSHIDVCINTWGKFALARKRCIGAG